MCLYNQQSIIFAAVVDGEFAGFTQLYPTFSSIAMKKAYILNDLFVMEQYRKNGIAKVLMKEAFAFVKGENARFIALETGAANVKA